MTGTTNTDKIKFGIEPKHKGENRGYPFLNRVLVDRIEEQDE